MSTEMMRLGRFVVLDRGDEIEARYAVIEHDEKGPILRAGPYRVLQIAIEACQQFHFRAELQEERHASQE